MMEHEWRDCSNPIDMLPYITEGNPCGRKLRLFACACCRQIWHLLDEPCRSTVEIAEQYADHLVGQHQLHQAEDSVAGSSPYYIATAAKAAAGPSSVDAALTCCEHVAHVAAGGTVGTPPNYAVRNQKRTELARLLRHIIGNPFHPYPAPAFWPSSVYKLTDALYNGQDCGFALHDALLEAGHPELAAHFRAEARHPKGCWVVDVILGNK